MRIRLKTILAGPDGSCHPGIHNLPEEQALALIQGGYAEAAVAIEAKPSAPEIETAVAGPEEAAIIPRTKGRKARKKG